MIRVAVCRGENVQPDGRDDETQGEAREAADDTAEKHREKEKCEFQTIHWSPPKKK
jgi:hypothetical protein